MPYHAFSLPGVSNKHWHGVLVDYALNFQTARIRGLLIIVLAQDIIQQFQPFPALNVCFAFFGRHQNLLPVRQSSMI